MPVAGQDLHGMRKAVRRYVAVHREEDEANDMKKFDTLLTRQNREKYPVKHVKLEDFGMYTDGRTHKIKRNSYLLEDLALGETHRGVVLPNTYKYSVWQALMILSVCYTTIMAPIELCFDDVQASLPTGLWILDVVIDIIFLSDIVLNFHLAIVVDHRLNVDKSTIRRKYLRKWFAIDAIGSFPGDTIFLIVELAGGGFRFGPIEAGSGGAAAAEGAAGTGQSASLAGAVQLLKIPKLLRVGRIFRKLSESMQAVGSVFNILVLLCFVVLVNHWLACAWYLITKNGGGWAVGEGLVGRRWTDQYPVVFYNTLMMLMGDSVDVQSGVEHMISSMIVIAGITLNATLFASISSYASQITAAQNAHAIQFASITDSIKTLRLPPALSERIFEYYRYCWNCHRDFAAQKLLDSLPAIFQRRCALLAHGRILRSFEPLAEADEHFLAQLSTKLRLEVFLPEAYILLVGQVYDHAFFIARGVAQVSWPHPEMPETLNVVNVTDYFGEVGLFFKTELHFTVRAKTHLDTYRLDRNDFQQLLRMHPISAVMVADGISRALPGKLARQVRRDIYHDTGLKDFLPTAFYRWRPPKGLATRILTYAASDKRKASMDFFKAPARPLSKWKKVQSSLEVAKRLRSIGVERHTKRVAAVESGATFDKPPSPPRRSSASASSSSSSHGSTSSNAGGMNPFGFLGQGMPKPAPYPAPSGGSAFDESDPTLRAALHSIIETSLASGRTDPSAIDRMLREMRQSYNMSGTGEVVSASASGGSPPGGRRGGAGRRGSTMLLKERASYAAELELNA